MLNELEVLARSLQARGLVVESWDRRVKPYKKGHAYIARLGKNGGVARVEWMDEEQVAALRRISPQNEKSFPGFNLNHAVFKTDAGGLGDEPACSAAEQAWNELTTSHEELPLGGGPSDRRALRTNLGFAGRDLAADFERGDAELAPTLALVRRMEQLEPEAFLRDLGRAAVESVRRGELDRDKATTLLFGKYKEKICAFEPVKSTLILDIDDAFEQGGRVASVEAARAWNQVLLESQNESQGEKVICALSGGADVSIGEKMPQPTLPGVGQTYLMSMNKATPCQTRYGMTSTAVFRIGQRTGQRVTDALRFITSESRSGKTWAKVPNASSDDNDLLVSYLEEDPGSELAVVDLFADIAANAEGEAALYEARTEGLLRALRGCSTYEKDTAVRIFAISKLDPGRAQVLFAGRYSLGDIERGFEEWTEGMRNIPGFGVRVAGGKGKRAEWREPVTPSPIEVLRSFKTLWMRGGADCARVPGVDLSLVYQLMLDGKSSVVGPLLNRYLRLIRPLVEGLGALGANEKAVGEKGRRESLIAVPLLGLLLMKMGFAKEKYMDSAEFLLGRYLQLTDRLHKLYCEIVRRGDVPPQLAGNAALGAALQNPQRAFLTASQRTRTYWAWADSFQGDKAGVAIWLRRRIGEVCGELGARGLPPRIDDAGRAALFLGYLGELNSKEAQ